MDGSHQQTVEIQLHEGGRRKQWGKWDDPNPSLSKSQMGHSRKSDWYISIISQMIQALSLN